MMISPKVLAVLIVGSVGLITLIVFLIALIKAIKDKNGEKVKNLLLNAAREAVSYAESILGIDGETKKLLAMTKMNQIFIDEDVKYNEAEADVAIENAIEFSKEVNAHEVSEDQKKKKSVSTTVKATELTAQEKIARLKELLNL